MAHHHSVDVHRVQHGQPRWPLQLLQLRFHPHVTPDNRKATMTTTTTKQFIAIPLALVTHTTLSPRARALGAYLYHVGDPLGRIPGPSSALAAGRGLGSERSIRVAMAELVDAGFVHRKRLPDRQVLYCLQDRTD